MPIRVQMPNGTVRPFREGTPKSVIRKAQADMLSDMKASGHDNVVVTQATGTRPSEPPQSPVPTYPAYPAEDEKKHMRDRVAQGMDDLSMAAKAGGVAARLGKVPALGPFLGAVSGLLGLDPVQNWVADQAIDAENRRVANIYNVIGNNALRQHGGIK